MAQIKLVLWGCVCLLLPVLVQANGNARLSQQRTNFKLAQKALQTNQISQFNKLNKQLTGYPLQPYLDYLYLRHKLNQTATSNILQFLTKQQGTFYATRLRNSWLNRLAHDKKWSLFLAQYQEPQSISRQCLRLQALIATGQEEQALQEIPKLWLVPRSQHKNCDPVFKYWQDKKLLTDKLRLQRIMLALNNNQFSLAKYLAKSLKKPQKTNHLIAHWQQAHNSPQSFLKNSLSHLTDNSDNRTIIQHAIKRLTRKSTEQAYDIWQHIKSNYQFSEQDKIITQRDIAQYAALNHDDSALKYFSDIPNNPWRVRAALWKQDWQSVYDAILSLNINIQQQSVWQYWLARSQAKLGMNQAAAKTYQSLIMNRDFYSFLAADRIKQPYQMNHNPIEFEQSELDTLLQRPAVARLKEFYALDLKLEARRQAYALKQKLSSRELQLLAILTHQWNWHNQTIALLGKARYWDALDLRFPIVYDKAILQASKTNGMDPSWLLGITRQESAFNPNARSHVGARGLMQLMPKTGKLIARLIHNPLKRTSELLNPDRNIQLGSAYLRRMFDQNQKNIVLATASYNAGPQRVSQWLPKHTLSADIWIENIPFTETRRYTKSVLGYATIFDYQRKQTIKPISSRMPAIQPEKP